VQADGILPKIIAFKQYYLRQQELITVHVIQRRTVMWRIPPPNSRLSFEVSAIFWGWQFYDILRNARYLWHCLLKFYLYPYGPSDVVKAKI